MMMMMKGKKGKERRGEDHESENGVTMSMFDLEATKLRCRGLTADCLMAEKDREEQRVASSTN